MRQDRIVLFGGIIIAATGMIWLVLSMSYGPPPRATLIPVEEIEGIEGTVSESEPPPIELSRYGAEVANFQYAKTAAKIDNAKLPTYLPAEFELESIRTKVQEDKGDIHNMITAIYTESGKQTTDSDDFREIIENGAVVILYIKDSSYLSPDYDWEKQVQMSVNEEPDIRGKVMINGSTALLIKGTSDYWLTAKAKVMQDGTFIEILTARHDTSELEKMLQTMLV